MIKLVEIAYLLDADPALILGALLDIKNMNESKKLDLTETGLYELNKGKMRQST